MNRVSQVNPSSAEMTAKVMISASEVTGEIPTKGRFGVMPGWVISRSSMMT